MDDPVDIAYWQRVGPSLTTSGELAPHDPERLGEIGVRRVINLALDTSPGALPDEAARMAVSGIDYVHIPVPFDAPSEDHFAAFSEAIEAAGDGPVHVHCIMNWRASAFVYRWNRANGMAEDEARALMHQHWNPETSDHADAPTWAKFIGDA